VSIASTNSGTTIAARSSTVMALMKVTATTVDTNTPVTLTHSMARDSSPIRLRNSNSS
jgi:hypothetical protein